MKNKFLASVIAGVMVMTMLGTVAFAADAVTINKDVLKPESYQDGQTTHTLFAFAANSKDAVIADAIEDPTKIIAVEQSADEARTISIDSSKLSDASYVIVYYSGNAAAAATKTVIPVTGTPVNVEIAANAYTGGDLVHEIEIGGNVYTDLIAATYTFSVADINNWGSLGAEFTQTKNAATATNTLVVDDITELFEGDGNVEITFGFTGVTAADGDFTALPIYQQYEAE